MQELLTRSIAGILPGKEAFEKRLLSETDDHISKGLMPQDRSSTWGSPLIFCSWRN